MKLVAAPRLPAPLRLALVAALVAAAALLAPRPARAQEAAERPSVFTYAGRGFLAGGMIGVSAGYLAARSGGWNSDDDWPPLAYGTGIGALVGGAAGLTLGIVDMSNNTPGYGAIVLRDTVYGTGFGAVAGGIVGALTMISTEKGEHVLLGGSVGALIGAAGGVVLGIIEGNRALARGHVGAAGSGGFNVALSAARGIDGAPVWMPAVLGVY